MQIIDYSHQPSSSSSKASTHPSPVLETITAAMIFILPALILFLLSTN
ncbi:hypothetical protein MICH65_0836 [Candidatus Chazhemtobacterium aquaticus]|uniref:Uncharacterized protein n=1 Tax=Candidatus Chazhemtobacterium aquaticus TaxID=2715735 RepID=A0A857N6K7_9BACT|nr:hypothetical protein MICH65_0836 [Candidatus Chazhemtobacterium aquaticus]